MRDSYMIINEHELWVLGHLKLMLFSESLGICLRLNCFTATCSYLRHLYSRDTSNERELQFALNSFAGIAK